MHICAHTHACTHTHTHTLCFCSQPRWVFALSLSGPHPSLSLAVAARWSVYFMRAPKTAFGSFTPVPRIQNLRVDSKPLWRRRPGITCLNAARDPGPDSGARPSPACPRHLPTPGTAHPRSTPPRPPPHTGWLPSGPSAPSRPGERTRGHTSASLPSAPCLNLEAESANAGDQAGREMRRGLGLWAETVRPLGRQQDSVLPPHAPSLPGLQDSKDCVARSSH